MSKAIAVLAKAPLPGHVKTRLLTCLSAEQAAELHAAFVADTWDKLQVLTDVTRYLYCDLSWPAFEKRAGRKAFRLQRGADLGERMLHTIDDLNRDGNSHVLLLGSDSPTLPLEYVRDALHRLDRTDAVLGPAEDGGYYILGCRRSDPHMFAGVIWSRTDTRRRTEEALQAAGFEVELLPPWYDVDTKADLKRLLSETTLPPHTRDWLARRHPVLE